MNIAELEQSLFELYPPSWAEPWDHIGLVCGDPNTPVETVALALDATVQTVQQASRAGAQVLITHHPVYLKAPSSFSPQSPTTPPPAACLWEAITSGVALIAMHTNLDRSADATRRLPAMLGLDPKCGIEAGRAMGAGSLGSVANLPAPTALDVFARQCRDTFGRVAQVFGRPDSTVSRAAFFTGSLGDSGEDALRARADVVVCGECGYHRALDLLGRGCAVIILGHDTSEEPLVDVLAERVAGFGFASERLLRIQGEPNWHSLDG